MSYDMILPRDIQTLLQHYTNYDHWKCLNSIFVQLSSNEFTIVDHYNQLFEKDIRRLITLLPDCQVSFKCYPANSFIYVYLLSIILPVDKLITKDSLLSKLIVICNCSNYSTQGVELIINDELRKGDYNQRAICIPSCSGGYRERKMISIL